MKKKASLVVLLALGFSLMFVGSAQAATTHTWGSWTLYYQEKSNWCWAAATKALIKRDRGTTVSQCNIVKKGQSTSDCANKGGTRKNYTMALSSYGVTPYSYTSGYPDWTFLRNLTTAGKGAIQSIDYVETGGGHAMPLIGTKADGKKVYVGFITDKSVTGFWITYDNFKAGKGGQGGDYKLVRGWVNN